MAAYHGMRGDSDWTRYGNVIQDIAESCEYDPHHPAGADNMLLQNIKSVINQWGEVCITCREYVDHTLSVYIDSMLALMQNRFAVNGKVGAQCDESVRMLDRLQLDQCIRYISRMTDALSRDGRLVGCPMRNDLCNALGGVKHMLQDWRPNAHIGLTLAKYYANLWAMSWMQIIENLCQFTDNGTPPNIKQSYRDGCAQCECELHGSHHKYSDVDSNPDDSDHDSKEEECDDENVYSQCCAHCEDLDIPLVDQCSQMNDLLADDIKADLDAYKDESPLIWLYGSIRKSYPFKGVVNPTVWTDCLCSNAKN
jgi:hypothetical protein